jgi:hypothetical protein
LWGYLKILAQILIWRRLSLLLIVVIVGELRVDD